MKTQNLKNNLKASFTKENMMLGLIVMCSVCLLVLIVTIFTVLGKEEGRIAEYEQRYKKEIALKEQSRVRDSLAVVRWQQLALEKDKTIVALLKKDTTYRQIIDENNRLLTDINKRNAQISGTISKYSSSDLQRAYANFR